MSRQSAENDAAREALDRLTDQAFHTAGDDAGRQRVLDDRAAVLRVSVLDLVLDSMTPPPCDPDDPFWFGAQWAFDRVRDALATRVIPPGEGDTDG